MNKEEIKKMLAVSSILFKYNVPVDEAKIIGAYIDELQQENKELHNKIEKVVEVLDEILVYDDFSDITQGFGNVKEELKFYLSECKTWEDFRKKNEILKDSDVDE